MRNAAGCLPYDEMNINIICIGKLKEKYWRDACAEYGKRLGSYCTLNIIELKEAPLRANPSAADEEAVKSAEGKEILRRIAPGDFCVSLEIKGKRFSSEALAQKLDDLAISGKSTVDFVIGGSLGLSAEVSRRADLKLSFSDMTFPHQMMRVILLEQIYRSFKINRGETYHK